MEALERLDRFDSFRTVPAIRVDTIESLNESNVLTKHHRYSKFEKTARRRRLELTNCGKTTITMLDELEVHLIAVITIIATPSKK